MCKTLDERYSSGMFCWLREDAVQLFVDSWRVNKTGSKQPEHLPGIFDSDDNDRKDQNNQCCCRQSQMAETKKKLWIERPRMRMILCVTVEGYRKNAWRLGGLAVYLPDGAVSL
jgi:hypothetical protein